MSRPKIILSYGINPLRMACVRGKYTMYVNSLCSILFPLYVSVLKGIHSKTAFIHALFIIFTRINKFVLSLKVK